MTSPTTPRDAIAGLLARICWPCVIGGALGLVISGYAFVYAPMRANYERGGCVFLTCDGKATR